jgi:hypothetical protein
MKSPNASAPALPRRDFLKNSTTLALGAALAASTTTVRTAAERKRSIGANDRIRIAQIGCGNRGRTAHMQGIYKIERPDHFLNWLQCMRSGETPHASIDDGYQHAVAVLMAVISYETGKKTFYDRAKRLIRTA